MRRSLEASAVIALLLATGPALASGAAERGGPAASARDFCDSIGVNTHFAFSLDPKSTWHDAGGLVDALAALGVRHVRDGLIPAYAIDPAHAQSSYVRSFARLGERHIGIDLIAGPGQVFGKFDEAHAAVESVVALRQRGAIVDAVEGPNELDSKTWSYHGRTYKPAYVVPAIPATPVPWATDSFARGIVTFQKDLFEAIRRDRRTAGVTVIGPSEGGTYSFPYTGKATDFSQPVPTDALYPWCDLGNFHPYTFGGNFETQHFAYDTIPDWYYGNSQSPGVTISPRTADDGQAMAFKNTIGSFQNLRNGKVIGARPMAATEKGYFTGSLAKSVTQATFAKYVPRVFADDFLFGIRQTYLYELLDEGTDPADVEQNFGLVKCDGTPKPAYYTLQHLLAILNDPASDAVTARRPGALAYSIDVDVPAEYRRDQRMPDTVLHLLLQKSDGTFELLLWNDVSSSALTDADGRPLPGPARDIDVPPFKTTVRFQSRVAPSATLHALNPYATDAAGALVSKPVRIDGDAITLDVPDYVVILEFKPAAG